MNMKHVPGHVDGVEPRIKKVLLVVSKDDSVFASPVVPFPVDKKKRAAKISGGDGGRDGGLLGNI